MTARTALTIAAAVAVAVAAGMSGCGSDSCPLETPQVNALPTCTEPPNQPVSYPVRLCPTCNQTGATCAVQISGGNIFLDIKAEACQDPNSCGGVGCSNAQFACSFTTPGTEGTYAVITENAATGGTLQTTLLVSATQPASCALPTAGL